MSDSWRLLWLMILLMFMVPAQVLLIPQFVSPVFLPHLGIVGAFLFGWLAGEGVGVVVGLILGLLFDRFTAGTVGLHMLILPCVGVAAGLVRRLLPEPTFPHRLGILFVFVLAAEGASLTLFALTGSVTLDGWLIVHQLLPGLLADMVLGGLVLALAAGLGGARRALV